MQGRDRERPRDGQRKKKEEEEKGGREIFEKIKIILALKTELGVVID